MNRAAKDSNAIHCNKMQWSASNSKYTQVSVSSCCHYVKIWKSGVNRLGQGAEDLPRTEKLSNFLHKTSKFAGITLMHFCPAIIGWFLLPRARFPKWAVAPFEATWALWAAPILHRFSSAHLVNLRSVKLKIEISVGKWVGAVVFEWIETSQRQVNMNWHHFHTLELFEYCQVFFGRL